jgi:hypothetical protein
VIARAALSGFVATAVLPMAACRAVDTPLTFDTLAPLVAAQRQCAPLIAGAWPIDLSAERLRAPGIDALVAAGLLTREPVVNDPGGRPRFVIAIAPGGRDWVELRQLTGGGSKTPFLCYGRRQLVDVGTAQADTASYRYRVVEAASWTKRADIQAAYPFLRIALNSQIEASASAVRRNGAWQLPDHADWRPGSMLDGTGFYPCLPDDRERACG